MLQFDGYVRLLLDILQIISLKVVFLGNNGFLFPVFFDLREPRLDNTGDISVSTAVIGQLLQLLNVSFKI